MKKAFDLTEVRTLLRRMIASGYITLEDLDTPSMGWHENAKSFRLHHPKYQQHEYRNPLRDPEPDPVVSVSDPRDFTPAQGVTPTVNPPLPLAEPAEPLSPSDLDF